MWRISTLIFNVLLVINNVSSEEYTPIVIWHGMGDSCCFPFSIGAIVKDLEKTLPNTYVTSLRIGDSLVQDVENGYFMHPNKQVDMACKLIKEDEGLQGGYNAIGFSQGGQFLRAVAQRCPDPPMKNLITLGAQHQGVYGLPNCGSLSHPVCDYMRKLLNYAAYKKWVQDFLTQATYWHDPLNEDLYKKASSFLGEINNEMVKNETYINNLAKLENLVMVKFDNDSMVQPVASEWFGFYKPGQSVEIEDLKDSAIYQEDRLGLREMDSNGKLHFISTPGNHLQFEWSWFVENIVEKFLKTAPAKDYVLPKRNRMWYFK